MKIAIGMKIHSGPFGGGNQFGKTLVEYLKNNGDEVVFDLADKDIDLILITDPRKTVESSAFSPIKIINYVNNVNKKVILVQRINECDERKGTKTVNKQLALTNSIVDHTIFIASWLVDLFKNQGFVIKNYSVILNGADRRIFDFKKHSLIKKEKIRLVTHHWGASYLKGWDIYEKINKMLDSDRYKKKLEFHYVGQKPEDIKTENIIFHDPLSGKELAEELNKNDIYVTGSVNEPAGMHHIEGALCGLPLLYRESGALPEYCEGFGVSFNSIDDFEEKLDKLVKNYNKYAEKIRSYNNNSDRMCKEYLNLFNNLVRNRDEIVKLRDGKIYNPSFKTSFFIRYYYYYFLNKFLHFC